MQQCSDKRNITDEELKANTNSMANALENESDYAVQKHERCRIRRPNVLNIDGVLKIKRHISEFKVDSPNFFHT